MLRISNKRYNFVDLRLPLKRKSNKESNSSLHWNKRFKLLPSIITPSKRDKSTRILVQKSPKSKSSSERDMPHFLKKSTTSLQVLIPTPMLILKEIKSWLKRKTTSNIITTKTKSSLNIGSRLLFKTMLLEKKSDKSMSHWLNTWLKFKPSRKQKTILKLSSLLVKTNGLLTPH